MSGEKKTLIGYPRMTKLEVIEQIREWWLESHDAISACDEDERRKSKDAWIDVRSWINHNAKDCL